MGYHLIVRHAFGEYSRGDRITDPETIATLEREMGEHVARVAAPEETSAQTG